MSKFASFFKCLFTVSSVSFICLNAYGQTPASSSTTDGSSYDVATNSTLGLHNFRKLNPEKIDYNEYEGTPFFYPDFVDGSLLRTNGSFLDSLSLKYDVFLESFIAKQNDEEIYIDTRYCREIRMKIEGEEIVFKRVDPRNPETFYMVLFESKDVTVYKDLKIGIAHGQNSGIAKTPDRFFHRDRYYVMKDKEVFNIKRKKKDIWKYFSDEDVKLMEDYLKSNKLKLKSDKAYREMMRILNSKA